MSGLSNKFTGNSTTGGQWESLDNDHYEMGSQDPIAPPNKIIMKTDVSVRTHAVYSDEKSDHRYHGNAV